jgi:hypothetical protein
MIIPFEKELLWGSRSSQRAEHAEGQKRVEPELRFRLGEVVIAPPVAVSA